jgi:hypothetical protein
MCRIQCKWTQTIGFSHLHYIRHMWNSTSKPGLNFASDMLQSVSERHFSVCILCIDWAFLPASCVEATPCCKTSFREKCTLVMLFVFYWLLRILRVVRCTASVFPSNKHCKTRLRLAGDSQTFLVFSDIPRVSHRAQKHGKAIFKA